MHKKSYAAIGSGAGAVLLAGYALHFIQEVVAQLERLAAADDDGLQTVAYYAEDPFAVETVSMHRQSRRRIAAGIRTYQRQRWQQAHPD